MQIQGPISIGMLEQDDGVSREIHIGFRPDFRAASLEEQARSFSGYVDDLAVSMVAPGIAEGDRAGINLIHKICAELLPYIQAGEIALNEELVVEIGAGPAISLAELAGATS